MPVAPGNINVEAAGALLGNKSQCQCLLNTPVKLPSPLMS